MFRLCLVCACPCKIERMRAIQVKTDADAFASYDCLASWSSYISIISLTALFGLHHLNVKLFNTTLVLLNAIASPLSAGPSPTPTATSAPAATGIRQRLKTNAHAKLVQILWYVACDSVSSRGKESNGQVRRRRIKSDDECAIELPDPSAMPSEAEDRAGESLMPSPTKHTIRCR